MCEILRDGDHYDALRDCLKALNLNPGHLKAHFRLARCLFELKYVAEALDCLDDFKGKFPEQAHSNACDALDKDIKAALSSKTESGRRWCCSPDRQWSSFIKQAYNLKKCNLDLEMNQQPYFHKSELSKYSTWLYGLDQTLVNSESVHSVEVVDKWSKSVGNK